MAESLLAHLYSRIKGSQEDVATYSLQYLISQSKALNNAFTFLVANALGVEIIDEIQYSCQVSGDEKERPDMAGTNESGQEVILCEMKFYAGLTQNQPLAYLKRLKKNNGLGLVFVCPEARKSSLWATLCNECNAEPNADYCIETDGIKLALITWDRIIKELNDTAIAVCQNLLHDIHQLKGFCDEMDSTAFIPFTAEDLDPIVAKKEDRYYTILDEVVELLRVEPNHVVSLDHLRATPNRNGYSRYIMIDNYACDIAYDRPLWESNSSISTPFWIGIFNDDWKQNAHIKEKIKCIKQYKKDNEAYDRIYLALEPLQNAIKDEVCKDLKEQILAYLEILK